MSRYHDHDDMVRHKYAGNMNDPEEFYVHVINVVPRARGYSVLFKNSDAFVYCGLQEFKRRFPHKLAGEPTQVKGWDYDRVKEQPHD